MENIKEKDIYTLKKTVELKRQNKKLSEIFKGKVKLNFALDEIKFFDKLIETYSKILSPIFVLDNKIEKIKELVETENIKLNFVPIDEFNPNYEAYLYAIYRYNYTRATRPASTKDLKGIKLYEVSVIDISNEKLGFSFVTTFDMPIVKKLRTSYFPSRSTYDRFNLFDIRRFIAELLINKECQEYIITNKEEFQYAVIKSIFEKPICKDSKECFEKKLYALLTPELITKYYIDCLDIQIAGYSTYSLNRSAYLIKMLEGDFNTYSSLSDIYGTDTFNVSLDLLRSSYKIYKINPKNKLICKMIFKEMAKDNEQIELYEQYIENSISDYAKSYQTKKNIPTKVQTAMENSKFLKHFSYVEFDSCVDLEEMKAIENEFDKIANILGLSYMGNTRKQRDMRFKRLGHHRAGGLYFQFSNCVCVDLDSPTSLLHELSHMLDATIMGIELNQLFQFRIIANKYIDTLDSLIDSLPKDDPLVLKYYGRTKFNRDYYCYYPEIFARCSEIYLNRVVKLKTNLLGNCNSFAYPEDKELEKMIKDFYEEKVFTELNLNYIEEVRQPAVASNKILNVIAYKSNKAGQLTFF